MKNGLLFVFILVGAFAFGQPEDEGPAPPPPAAPIDSWVYCMGLVGLFYGGFIFYDKRFGSGKKM